MYAATAAVALEGGDGRRLGVSWIMTEAEDA
jgi:hypothetical protein